MWPSLSIWFLYVNSWGVFLFSGWNEPEDWPAEDSIEEERSWREGEAIVSIFEDTNRAGRSCMVLTLYALRPYSLWNTTIPFVLHSSLWSDECVTIYRLFLQEQNNYLSVFVSVHTGMQSFNSAAVCSIQEAFQWGTTLNREGDKDGKNIQCFIVILPNSIQKLPKISSDKRSLTPSGHTLVPPQLLTKVQFPQVYTAVFIV